MMNKVVLFDVDGTLADISHRRIFLERSPPDWKLFNSSIVDDVPNTPIVELYRALWSASLYELILVTGRMERYRQVTEDWLNEFSIPFSRIIFRHDDDFREDSIVKEEFLDVLKDEGKTILFVVDDRKQVVDMWRRNGITCLQCAEGNF